MAPTVFVADEIHSVAVAGLAPLITELTILARVC